MVGGTRQDLHQGDTNEQLEQELGEREKKQQLLMDVCEAVEEQNGQLEHLVELERHQIDLERRLLKLRVERFCTRLVTWVKPRGLFIVLSVGILTFAALRFPTTR